MKSPLPGWIIEPAGRAVRFVGQETSTAGLLQRALTHLEGSRALFRNVLLIAQRSGMRTGLEAAKRLYNESPHNEKWAKELRESDYTPLNAHSLIAIWGALETCVEDTVIAILINWPDAAATVRVAPVSLELQAFESFEDAQRIFKRIERKLGVAGDIVATYAAILHFFSLTADVAGDVASTLREANAVRNCLLHRGGKADARTLREAPGLGLTEGDSVEVSSASYLKYHDAVSQWLVALSKSVAASRYFPS